MTKKLLIWLDNAGKEDSDLISKDFDQLADLATSGFPIPPGFLLTNKLYLEFFKLNSLEIKIKHLLGTINYSDIRSVKKASFSIKKVIETSEFPKSTIDEIFKSYLKLGGTFKNPLVKISASATNHNTLREIPLNFSLSLQGEANLILAIKEAYSSLFDEKILNFIKEKSEDIFSYLISTSIQKQPLPESSANVQMLGSYDKEQKLTIRAFWGLNQPIDFNFQDEYTVNKNDNTIINKKIAKQTELFNFEHSEIIKERVEKKRQSQQKISDSLIKEISNYSKKLEKHFFFPQDSKWEIEKGKLYLLSISESTTNFRKENIFSPHSPTATKILLSASTHHNPSEIAKLFSDGIGLLNTQNVLKQHNTHPKKLIEDERHHMYVDLLSDTLSEFASSFSPRPVVYKLLDMTSEQLLELTHSRRFEPSEKNPEMGFRGAFRHIHDEELLSLELRAVKKVRNKMGYKNLWMLLPFVRTPEEFFELKKIISASGLYRSASFKILLSLDIPSNVILIDDFLKLGVDGVVINGESLLKYTLGVDMSNTEIYSGFSKDEDSILWEIEKVVKACRSQNIPISFLDDTQTPSYSFLEKLIGFGITNLIINSEGLEMTRNNVSEIEKKLWQK